MIIPYKIKRNKKSLQLWCVTMIDSSTGWFEIKDVPGTKQADILANIFEKYWLNRYPWPQKFILDRVTEFMAEFRKMVQDGYGVKNKPRTKKNPHKNAIIHYPHNN